MAPETEQAGNETKGESSAGLVLYGYPQCPFCNRVLSAIDQLGIDIPLNNTMQDAGHREAVLEAMGRGTVPVLRVEDTPGEVEWIPESADIIRYLMDRFG